MSKMPTNVFIQFIRGALPAIKEGAIWAIGYNLTNTIYEVVSSRLKKKDK